MPFLPITKQEMLERGWERPDFIIVTGDAYVDHPSFGTAIVSRVLEAEGYSVAGGCSCISGTKREFRLPD